MKILYDSSLIDKQGKMYLNHIKKCGHNINYIDIYNINNIYNYIDELEDHSTLLIRPVSKDVLNYFINSGKDIEQSHSPSNPTVDAILDVIYKYFGCMDKYNDYCKNRTNLLHCVRGKRIIIVNRSDLIGKPLFRILIDNGATVMCVSKYDRRDIQLDILRSDIIITGTGGRIDYSDTTFPKDVLLIDLSGETHCPQAITRLDTVKILLNEYAEGGNNE